MVQPLTGKMMLAAVALLLAGPLVAQPAAAPQLAAQAPVASVRLSFDRQGIGQAQTQGWADVAAQRQVSVDDPVRIASISKLVTAIGVMRLVEAGQLDLDADVSDTLGWRLRHPQFPDVPISLRLLLSHRAGLTDAAGYYQVPLGGQVKDLLAEPRAWDPAHAPGTFFRYANIDFPLIAAVMEKATGERFDRLMDRLVIAPLKLSACFNWSSCDQATLARAVVLYDAEGTPVRDDLHGQPPACAVVTASDGNCDLSRWRAGDNGALFSPQGGLRISARDLAKVGRLLLNQGEVDGVRLLSPASVQALTQVQWKYNGGNGMTSEEDDSGQGGRGFVCRYALAVQHLATAQPGCHDDPFGDGRQRIGHSGSAYGLLSGLWIDPQRGEGVVYFVTGMPDAREGGHSAFSAIEETMAQGGSVPTAKDAPQQARP